jgi:hypothetical protein
MPQRGLRKQAVTGNLDRSIHIRTCLIIPSGPEGYYEADSRATLELSFYPSDMKSNVTWCFRYNKHKKDNDAVYGKNVRNPRLLS